jgi:hypothetical protein
MSIPKFDPNINPLINSGNYNRSQLNVKDVQKPQNNSQIQKAINWIKINVFGQKPYAMILKFDDVTKLKDGGIISQKDIGKTIGMGEQVADQLLQQLADDKNANVTWDSGDAAPQNGANDDSFDKELALATANSVETYKTELYHEFLPLIITVRSLEENVEAGMEAKIQELKDTALYFVDTGVPEFAQQMLADAKLLVENYKKISSYEDKTVSDQKKNSDTNITFIDNEALFDDDFDSLPEPDWAKFNDGLSDSNNKQDVDEFDKLPNDFFGIEISDSDESEIDEDIAANNDKLNNSVERSQEKINYNLSDICLRKYISIKESAEFNGLNVDFSEEWKKTEILMNNANFPEAERMIDQMQEKLNNALKKLDVPDEMREILRKR